MPIALSGCAAHGVCNGNGAAFRWAASADGQYCGNRFSSSIFGGVTFPLYDAGTNAAMLDQARAEADSADARMVRVREADVRKIATSMRSCAVMPAPPRDQDPTRPSTVIATLKAKTRCPATIMPPP